MWVGGRRCGLVFESGEVGREEEKEGELNDEEVEEGRANETGRARVGLLGEY